MRRQLGASALAVVALLTATTIASGAAYASATTSVAADDIFYPEGQSAPSSDTKPAKPAADPKPEPSSDATGDREAALARGDRQAADLMGFLPSLYQGRWFQPGSEDVRRCIMLRESHANYRATNGTYHGAYQMSSALAVGATWMMQKEVRKEMGAEGVAIVEALRRTTPNNWNRYWQDRAFWTIWRDGAGAGHWGGQGC